MGARKQKYDTLTKLLKIQYSHEIVKIIAYDNCRPLGEMFCLFVLFNVPVSSVGLVGTVASFVSFFPTLCIIYIDIGRNCSNVGRNFLFQCRFIMLQ